MDNSCNKLYSHPFFETYSNFKLIRQTIKLCSFSQYCIGNTSCYTEYNMKQEIVVGRVCSDTYSNLQTVRFNKNICTLHLCLNKYIYWPFYEFLI